jgi:hypothetical protein
VSAATAPEATDVPVSVRLVDRLGRALTGPRYGRRRFLTQVAVIGAAMVVDPLRLLLRPGTAYATVCGDGASCGGGWTAFCCTVNNGANTCPPGSYAAGWWRIDDSPFCFGAARYIIDCNRSPGASCSCRCASGTCDQRRVCCNNFRYGQCNTQVPGVTEVVCRVVTCITPWEWDPACNRTVRVDNRTRTHNAPCLPGRNATRIDIKYQDMGQTGSILGRPLSAERAALDGGRLRRFANGTIFWRSATGALAIHGGMDEVHRSLGAETGALGYPTTEPRAVGDGAGLETRYQRGTIYQRTASATPVGVVNPFDSRFRSEGGPRGRFGYPTAVTQRADGSVLVRFQHSNLVRVSGASLLEMRADMFAAATAPAASSPDRVGWAIAAEQSLGGARLQRFESGVVTQRTNGALVAIGDDLAARWFDEGGPSGRWGRPTGAPRSVAGGRGRELVLAGATLYRGPGTGTRYLDGPLLTAYLEQGGPNGSLGLPTSDPVVQSNGQRRASFEQGAIVIAPDGSVSVLRERVGRRPQDMRASVVRPDDVPPPSGRPTYTPDDLTP